MSQIFLRPRKFHPFDGESYKREILWTADLVNEDGSILSKGGIIFSDCKSLIDYLSEVAPMIPVGDTNAHKPHE